MDDKTRLVLYRAMLRVRMFEERIVSVYARQDMKTPVHLCIGQEAAAAGVGLQLKKEDYIFSTHRNHGHNLVKGANMRRMVAELYGRSAGCDGGKGGSMHITDVSCGCMGTTAIVGGSIPLGAGAALAAKLRGDGRVGVSFFGDGASDEGVFQETLNFAALKKLPALFVCENNFYATNSRSVSRHAAKDVCSRAAVFGMYAAKADGNDAEAVYNEAAKALAHVRSGAGPAFLEFTTYRWKGHVGPEEDYLKGCRPKAELDEWKKKCPLACYEKKLLASGVLSEAAKQAMTAEIKAELDDAWAFALAAPYPQPEELFTAVYRGA